MFFTFTWHLITVIKQVYKLHSQRNKLGSSCSKVVGRDVTRDLALLARVTKKKCNNIKKAEVISHAVCDDEKREGQFLRVTSTNRQQ